MPVDYWAGIDWREPRLQYRSTTANGPGRVGPLAVITFMRIGEGIALNLTPGAKPTLTLAGVRADTALGLQRDRDLDSDNKVGISTGGWVAIGVGSAALIFGGLYLAADHIADCDEGECD